MKHILMLLLIASATFAAGADQMLILPKSADVRFDIADYLSPLEAHGDAGVCLWEDDKQGAFTVTIDGIWINDAWVWRAVMDSFAFPVTFFINSHLDVNWDTAAALYGMGHSVQSHSAYHRNAFTFYVDGKDSIESALGNICYTLAPPGGASDVYVDSAIMAGYNGIRNGGGLNRVIKTDYTGVKSNSTFNYDSVRVWAEAPDYNWKSHHMHGLNDSLELVVKERMRMLSRNKERVWLSTFPNIARYGQERDTHTLSVTSVTDNLISFTLTDSMSDSVFTYPLTVKVRVAGWDTVIAAQNGTPVDAVLKTDSLGTYALVKAVPDRGTVELSSGRTTFVSDVPAAVLRGPAADGLLYNVTGAPGAGRQNGFYLQYDPATGSLHKVMVLR